MNELVFVRKEIVYLNQIQKNVQLSTQAFKITFEDYNLSQCKWNNFIVSYMYIFIQKFYCINIQRLQENNINSMELKIYNQKNHCKLDTWKINSCKEIKNLECPLFSTKSRCFELYFRKPMLNSSINTEETLEYVSCIEITTKDNFHEMNKNLMNFSIFMKQLYLKNQNEIHIRNFENEMIQYINEAIDSYFKRNLKINNCKGDQFGRYDLINLKFKMSKFRSYKVVNSRSSQFQRINVEWIIIHFILKIALYVLESKVYYLQPLVIIIIFLKKCGIWKFERYPFVWDPGVLLIIGFDFYYLINKALSKGIGEKLFV